MHSVSCILDQYKSNESFREVGREEKIWIYSNRNAIGSFGDKTCGNK